MTLPAYQSTPEASTTGRASRLDLALAALLSQTPELLAASVVSFDGLPMASSLPVGMDEDRLAAMSAALLSLGERAAHGLGRGELHQVYVEGENGSVFLVSADDEAVLVAVSTKEAKIGLMLFEVKRAAESVAKILRQDDLAAAGTAPVAAPSADPGASVPTTTVHVPAHAAQSASASQVLDSDQARSSDLFGRESASVASPSWT